jgi:hypothetical protein
MDAFSTGDDLTFPLKDEVRLRSAQFIAIERDARTARIDGSISIDLPAKSPGIGGVFLTRIADASSWRSLVE